MADAPSLIPDAALLRKTRLKFMVRRIIGEPYVGKRLKMHHLPSLLRRLTLPKQSAILEVGCEDGYFTEWLSRRYPSATVEGLDIGARAIQ
jgi:2-polyprenyl-3-methyl-5-hydroxy-6-metoxy-1,4-benzoquinol methylase